MFDTFVIPRGRAGERGADLMERSGSSLRADAIQRLALQDTSHVLEIGFGPGLALEALVRAAPRGQVTGLDPSLLMHRRARKRNADALDRDKLDLVVGYAEQLPFPDQRFDAVLAIDSAHFWTDLPTALSEVRRVLHSDTSPLLLAFSPPSGGPPYAIINTLDQAGFDADYAAQSRDGIVIYATPRGRP